jgi:hypothetical protein
MIQVRSPANQDRAFFVPIPQFARFAREPYSDNAITAAQRN